MKTSSKNFKPGGCLKVQGGQKKCKNVPICQNNMTFLTDKALKSKNFREQKMYILTNDVDSRRTFEIKAKTMSALKRPIFLVTLIQAVVSKKHLDSFTK